MPWVKLDDHFSENPKLVAAGPMAGWLYIGGLCYAARHLTDGFIPVAQVPRLAAGVTNPKKQARQLVNLGLWEPGAGGYWIHDYLKYNPSREDAQQHRLEVSNARSQAGRKGAQARWSRRDSQGQSDTVDDEDGEF